MRYGSLCSGIECATVAWEELGWEAVFFSEIEPFPCAVLAHHYGSNLPGEPYPTNGVPNYGDMTKFKEWPDDAIDVLVGGTPCQDYSVAGLRLGMDGVRGQLSLTFVEISAKLRSDWLVWENVPGVLSSNGGRDFARFLGDLSGTKIKVPEGGWKNAGIVAGLPEAYGLAYRVLDAQYVRVDGLERAVPQRRRRVFVVGYLGDWRPSAAVLLEQEGLFGNTPPRRKAGQGIAPTISSRSTGGGGLGTDFDHDGGLVAAPIVSAAHYGDQIGRESHLVPEIANPLTAGMSASAARMPHEQGALVPEVAHTLRASFEASEDGSGRGTPLVPVAFDCKASGRNGFSVSDEIAPTLRSMGHANSHQNGGGHAAVAHEYAVRRLTPRECERLQGIPDDYTRIPWRGKPAELCPDGPRYKGLGNSMARNVMQWIGERIDMVDRLIKEGSL